MVIDDRSIGAYSVGTMQTHRTFKRRDEEMPRYPRLDIDQSHAPLVQRLSNNNSGAAIALIDLLRRGRKFGVPVSSDTAWCLKMLDTLGIYGADLHTLWGDVCRCSADEMIMLLRACHDGCDGVSRDTIMEAITCCTQGAATHGSLRSVSEIPVL